MIEPLPLIASGQEFASAVLANGLQVVTVEMPHLHSAEMVCYVGVGSRHEKVENAGISHFLEHLLFRGTRDFDTGEKLEQAFEEIGGSVNASVDAETTCFFSRFHPDHLNRTVFLFASLLLRPLFLDTEIERRIILEEALEDVNEKGEIICTDQLIAGLCWPAHPLSLPTIGSRESLTAIRREDLMAHHGACYTPENALLAVAGRVRHEEVMKAVAAHFGKWTGGSAKPVPIPFPGGASNAPRCAWVHDNDSQVEMEIAFRLPGRHDVPAAPLKILRRLLAGGMASRLMRRLREELGLIYGVEGTLVLFADSGLFSFSLAVAPEKMVETLRETLAVLDKICREPVAEEELARAAKGMLFDLEFSRDQTEEMAGRYGWGMMVGSLKTIDEERRAILAETPASLLATAARYLHPESLRGAVVGPFRDRDRFIFEEILQAYRRPRPSIKRESASADRLQRS